MEEYKQDWGQIIGAGIVALGTIAIVVNLAVFDVPAELLEKLALSPVWLQMGRWLGLAVSLGGGSLVLWRILRRRQPVEETPLQKAISYIQKIEGLLRADQDKHQQQLLAHIHTWRQTIEVIAQTLTDLNQNGSAIQDDLHRLPDAISDLESQLAKESSDLLRADLEQTLDQHKNQQQALKQLQIAQRRAKIQIERASAVLSTIYSQLLAYRSAFHMADYERLADDVDQEVQRLQKHLEVLHSWRANEK